MSSIQFTLIDRRPELLDAWRASFQKHLAPELAARFALVQTTLANLEGRYDCIVSPANSYGMMDGGLDYYISEIICKEDMYATTRAVQRHLYSEYRGFISPGQCCLVPLPEALLGPSNKLGFRYVAVCPTMRVPEDIRWNRDIVYESMWNLLVALDKHGRANPGDGEGAIRTVVMSGFGTGVGGISSEKCGEQMALAIKHFDMAVKAEETWSKIEWKTIYEVDDEIQRTR